MKNCQMLQNVYVKQGVYKFMFYKYVQIVPTYRLTGIWKWPNQVSYNSDSHGKLGQLVVDNIFVILQNDLAYHYTSNKCVKHVSYKRF